MVLSVVLQVAAIASLGQSDPATRVAPEAVAPRPSRARADRVRQGIDAWIQLSSVHSLEVPILAELKSNPRVEGGERHEIRPFTPLGLPAGKIRYRIFRPDPSLATLRRTDLIRQHAMDHWARAVGGQIEFVEEAEDVPTPLNIRFVRLVMRHGRPVAGDIQWSIHSSGKWTAWIRIATHDPEGRPMPGSAMRQALGHELGHLFGLEDNPREGFLMSRMDPVRPVTVPTPYEARTVRALFAWRQAYQEASQETESEPVIGHER